MRRGQFGYPLGHHAGAGAHGRHLLPDTGEVHLFDVRQRLELFGVDHRTVRVQRHRGACVTGAAATRDQGQAAVDAGLDDGRDLVLAIRGDDDKRHLDAPVGGVGGMRYPRQAAEIDVVPARDTAECAAHPVAQRMALAKTVGKPIDGGARGLEQARGILVVVEALLELFKAVVERLDQRIAPVDVVYQIVLQVRVALDDPHVAEHLEQHACRTPGAARAAQLLDQAPVGGAKVADHDLAVGERGVVVGDLADALHQSSGGNGQRGPRQSDRCRKSIRNAPRGGVRPAGCRVATAQG